MPAGSFPRQTAPPGGGGGGGGGDVTLIVALPLTPSLVAVTFTTPAAIPVTTPDDETEAMLVFALDHETTRPVRTLPLASRVVAARPIVLPNWMLGFVGETDTDATGTGEGDDDALVVAEATFEREPKTASWFKVPRKASTWKS